MRFRNTIQLFMENFKNIYRVLLYKFLVFLVACALCCAFILPEIQEIIKSTEMQNLTINMQNLIKAFTTLDEELLASSRQALIGESGAIREVLRYLTDMSSEIIWACVGCLVVFLVQCYMSILCNFAIGSIINDKMTTYAETPFFTSFISNLGKANKYALLFIPVTLAFWVVSFLIVYACLSILPVLLALFLSVTAVVCLQSLKMTIVGRWMPAQTVDEKLFTNPMEIGQLEKRQRAKELSSYIVSTYCIMMINVLGLLCTVGSSLIITVPASYVFLICMQYVNYYTAKGKKYFVTYEKIENNAHYGDSEHIFEYIEKSENNKEKGE